MTASRRTRSTLLAVAAIAVLAGAGCSSHDYTSEHFKSTSQVAKIAKWDCGTDDTEDRTRSDLEQYGFSSLPCEDGAIVIWTSDAKRAQLETSAGNELQPGHCRIDGGNWTVTGTQYAVEDAQKQLGGKKTCTS